jgi:hypothetical protein
MGSALVQMGPKLQAILQSLSKDLDLAFEKGGPLPRPAGFAGL